MDQVLILDFGSQYTQLIARRLRGLGVYCEIVPYSASVEAILTRSPRGLILSGGPSSVYDKAAPRPDPAVFTLGLPVLGVCYGMQLMAQAYGGKVARAGRREYGLSALKVSGGLLFKGFPRSVRAWMSHGDEVKAVPRGFKVTARAGAGISAMECPERGLYAVQFHPEVHHTEKGARLLENFARGVCNYRERWTPAAFLDRGVAAIREQAAGQTIICALSGGVDSSVAAALAHRAVGKKLRCLFVDNGLLRHGDRERMHGIFRGKLGLSLKIVDAAALFLGRLRGVTSPEKKRKIIGGAFIEVFEAEAKKIKDAAWLLQGTLYPDVIESVSVKGPSAVIKSHHNVGGLPARMRLGLIEPLRYYFKDEARELGRALGLPEAVLMQHPFPGPGLGIRVVGEVTPERLRVLRQADRVMREELDAAGWTPRIWQAFCALLPVRSVGVMGDERSYEYTAALRCVDSVDGMTADWSRVPHELLGRISSRIVGEVRGINRVVYDITSKPPATIEWE